MFRSFFILISFCMFFVTTTHAQVVHRRLWPWPSWSWPFPRSHPWPMDPPKPGPPPGPPKPAPSPKPSPPPGPSPCQQTPPTPQPKPPPAPSPSPCSPTPPNPQPKPPPAPGPSPCPSQPPKPQPKPSPAPGPSPCPPQPKPPPSPAPGPPKPPNPQPKPPPTPGPSPKPGPIPSPPQPPGPPPSPPPKPSPPKPPSPSPPKPPSPSPPKPPSPSPPKPPSPSPPEPHNKTIPAVFFFGDSTFDTGNNNNQKTKIKSNYRPYGMDFPMGVATGRFSNGKVASDYISKYLGVKETVPAYLDQRLQQNDLHTGVSFASGGAGYDPDTSEGVKVIPMLDQLTNFQDYKEKMKKLVGKKRTDHIVSKGVAIVVAGSNDLIYTYYGSGAQRLKNDIDSFTTIMADSAASFILQLYGYGARRIGVMGTLPLGCTPSQRVKKKKLCNEELNYAAQLFNSKLFIILGQLSKTLPNSTLVYMDIYSIFSQMLESPADYGFEEIKKPCCKTRLLGGGVFCKKYTSKICPNTSSYMFWDGINPSQRAYETLNKILVKEYIRFI